jgi:hypothetical protein
MVNVCVSTVCYGRVPTMRACWVIVITKKFRAVALREEGIHNFHIELILLEISSIC